MVYQPADGDMLQGLRKSVAIAWYFAWSDTRARYKRSVLGPFWLVLSTLIGVVGLGFVWSTLLHTDKAAFIPSLAIGLVVWNMITGSIIGGCTVFTKRASIIRNIKTPSLRLSLELLFQQIINFAHNLLVVLLVLVVFQQPLSLVTLLVIPGLLLVFINLWWVIQLLGFIGARFRDIDPLVQAIMPILFFLSPVLYHSHQLGRTQIIMAFNPMAYWLDIVRGPLQGVVPDARIWVGTILMAIVGWALALWMTKAKGARLPFWV